jgi:hypothetical protein
MALRWLRMSEGGILAARHDLRDRGLRLVGPSRGRRSVTQTWHGISHVPFAFGVASLRLCDAGRDPALPDGSMGTRVSRTVSWSHLDWVSNVGYQYLNFHYNPAHMIAVTFFFATTVMALSLHGSHLCWRQLNPGGR